MTFQPADTLSLNMFRVFSILMFITIFWSFRKAKVSEKIGAAFVVYVVGISLIVIFGNARSYIIPFLPLFFLTTMGLTTYLAFSKTGTAMMNAFSVTALIGFQGFRLPLELILHQWAKVGTIPETMTWTGQNWDIITGIVSLLNIPFVGRSKFAAWFIQIIGFTLLLNVFRVVIMSSPFPFLWDLENPLQLGVEFPYVLIVPLFVAPALYGHLLVFRKLLKAAD